MKYLLPFAFLFMLFACKKETINNYYYNGIDTIIRDTTIIKDTTIIRDTIRLTSPADSIVRLLDGNLVAWYPFTGNTGDSSTFKNHGTGSNVTLTTDHFGNANKAYYFNGTNSFVRIPHSQSLDLKTEYSISCWVRPDTNILSYGSHSMMVFYGDEVAGQDPYFFTYDVLRKCVTIGHHMNYGSDFNVLTMPSNVQFKNIWVHVTTSFNNATRTFTLYLNGLKVASEQFPNTTINYPTNSSLYQTFLGSACGKWSMFKGSLDEVRIYNREVSSEEAWALYKVR